MTPVQSAIVAACGYEILAITTKKIPTISMICRKYRVAEVAFLAWLIVHFHKKTEDQIIAEVKKVNANSFLGLRDQAHKYRQNNLGVCA